MTVFVLENPSTNAAENVAKIKAEIEKAHAEYMKDPSLGQVTVQLGAGTWVVTGDKTNSSVGAIELLSGVELTGSGTRETVIKLEDNFDARINGIVRTALETVENVTVSNLVIDGNRENQAEGSHQAGFICGIKEDGSGEWQANITIDGVEARNCTAYGINPHEITYNMTVKNSIAHNNGMDGFVADAVIGGLYEKNISYDNDRHGFNIQNATEDLVLKDNMAYDNGFRYMSNGVLSGGAGLTIQRGDIAPEGTNTIPWVNYVQVIGGSYHDNGKEGILVKLSDHVTIDSVDVYGNQRQGVRIEGSTYTIVQKSEIHDNSQEADNTYDEVNIRMRLDAVTGQTYYSLDTQIVDNFITSNGDVNARWGVREEPTNDDGGSSGTVISGNTISGMDTGSVSAPEMVNPVIGTAGNDLIGGLADPIQGTGGADEMQGLAGDDTYTVNHTGDVVIEQANEGTDHVIASVKFTLGANVENLTLIGAENLNGTGNELNNFITGNAGANTLKGGAGNDSLDGGTGADSLDGGDGNDTYYIDNAGDIIVEKDNGGLGGTDTVYSSISYTLPSQVENVILLGSADLNATGNSSTNVLTGNSGNNVLDGKGGQTSWPAAQGMTSMSSIIRATSSSKIRAAASILSTAPLPIRSVSSSRTWSFKERLSSAQVTNSTTSSSATTLPTSCLGLTAMTRSMADLARTRCMAVEEMMSSSSPRASFRVRRFSISSATASWPVTRSNLSASPIRQPYPMLEMAPGRSPTEAIPKASA
jgi:RTX calcium-binding nonapeptide repeat (4 copies)/Right handed beta helix region